MEDVLQAAAERSFYDDFQIYWNEEQNRYVIEDDYGMFEDDAASWTHADGLDCPTADGTSGLMETYEYFDNYKQIQRYVPEAIEKIKEGYTVSFAYLAVSNDDLVWDEDAGDYLDEDGELMGDNAVGWCLAWVVA